MSTDLLFEHFDTFATAPDGIARLREMILQLAVQGKLGTQDENDEPASVLLERLKKSEKINKKCKSTKIDESQEEDFPYLIPKNWIWIKFNEIVIDVQSGFACGERDSRGIVQLRMNNINPRGDFIWDKILRVPFDEVLKQKYELKSGDVVFNNTNSLELVGKSGLFKGFTEPIVYSNHFTRLRFDESSIDPAYVTIWLHYQWNSKIFEKICNKWIGQAAVNGTKLLTFLFPLPPTAEQHRIVEKVDRLMSLCDELEAKQQQERAGCLKLGTASLVGLQNVESPEEFERLWAQVCDAFDLILDCPENVGVLRQTILRLAVQGKLGTQDERDEPADVLLDDIRKEKARSIKNGKPQKEKPLKFVNGTDLPFKIPNKWVWTYFGKITFNRDGERKPLEKAVRATRHGAYDYYGASGVIDTVDDYLFDKPLLLIGEDGANLVNRSTPIAFIAHGKFWVNNHAHVLDGISFEFLRYLEIYINSINLQPYITGMAQPKMNQAKMNSIPVPLPPLAEQERIIAKVDALMALCNHLDVRLKERADLQGKYANTMIKQVNAEVK